MQRWYKESLRQLESLNERVPIAPEAYKHVIEFLDMLLARGSADGYIPTPLITVLHSPGPPKGLGMSWMGANWMGDRLWISMTFNVEEPYFEYKFSYRAFHILRHGTNASEAIDQLLAMVLRPLPPDPHYSQEEPRIASD